MLHMLQSSCLDSPTSSTTGQAPDRLSCSLHSPSLPADLSWRESCWVDSASALWPEARVAASSSNGYCSLSVQGACYPFSCCQLWGTWRSGQLSKSLMPRDRLQNPLMATGRDISPHKAQKTLRRVTPQASICNPNPTGPVGPHCASVTGLRSFWRSFPLA